MTNLEILFRCSIVVMAFAAFGFLATIVNGPPFDTPRFWDNSLTSMLYLGALGLSIAICLAGGLLLMRRLRSGLLTTVLALVYMLGCSVVAAFLPPFLVMTSGYNYIGGHIPGAFAVAFATIGIGVIGFLIFGAASSLIRQR